MKQVARKTIETNRKTAREFWDSKAHSYDRLMGRFFPETTGKLGSLLIPPFCHAANLKSKLLTIILSLLGQKPQNSWTPEDFMDYVERRGFKIKRSICVNEKIPLVYLLAIKG